MKPIQWVEQGLIPDVIARAGMRQLIRRRLRAPESRDPERRTEAFARFLGELRSSPIAINTADANVQHYEVPAEFFRRHLGPCLKYSCCYYPSGTETLAEAEQHMLALYAERAGLKDGQRMLDLGCGWGSLSLWLAQRYPNSEIVGLSNSHGQRAFILEQARQRDLNNLRIVTGNVVDFDFPADGVEAGFDRVLSIEMFEHMKNYGLLLAKIARWMRPEGRLFVHIFAHPVLAYHYEIRDETDWMTKYFFLGGTMPSQHLLAHFQDDLKLIRQWWVNGQHYEKTSNHWLANMDAQREAILPIFEKAYGGKGPAKIWFNRWRMFYMAVAEFFGLNGGREWGVGHYLFEKR